MMGRRVMARVGFLDGLAMAGGLHDNDDNEIIVISAVIISAIDMMMGVFLYTQRR